MGIYGPRTVYCIALKDCPGCHEFLLQDDGKWLHVKETTEIGALLGLACWLPTVLQTGWSSTEVAVCAYSCSISAETVFCLYAHQQAVSAAQGTSPRKSSRDNQSISCVGKQ